jgi:hypothetical protein
MQAGKEYFTANPVYMGIATGCCQQLKEEVIMDIYVKMLIFAIHNTYRTQTICMRKRSDQYPQAKTPRAPYPMNFSKPFPTPPCTNVGESSQSNV